MVVPRQQFVEGLPPNKFHYDIRSARLWFLAHIENGYDSRMRQAARSFRFPEEALTILAFLFRGLAGQRNCLYCHDAIDLGIARFVDNTHGAPSEEHTSELQSLRHLVCRLLLEKNRRHGALRRLSSRSHTVPVQSERHQRT